MSELSSLERRIDAALERIQNALATQNGGDGGDDLNAARDRIAALEAENRQLSAQLTELNAARSQDLAQLDQLIGQLRPLVEEAS